MTLSDAAVGSRPQPAPASAAIDPAAGRSRFHLLLGVMRSPTLRGLFLLAMGAWLTITLVDQGPKLWHDVQGLSLWVVGVALLANTCAIICCMLVWRAVLADLGSRMTLPMAWRVFFVAQLGKYIPGSIWPVLAQMELSADQGVPRERAAISMLLSTGVMVSTGALIGAITLPFVTSGSDVRYVWALLTVLVALLLLFPPVTTRLLNLVLRLMRRPAMHRALSLRGLAVVLGLALLSWFCVAVMTYLLVAPFAGRGGYVFVAALASCALSWVFGYLAVFAPAGAGVREATIVAVLTTQTTAQAALLVALVSRALSVVSDAVTAATAAAMVGRRKLHALRAANRAPAPPQSAN